MGYIICGHAAPPEVFDVLNEFNTHKADVGDFMQRTIKTAREEGFAERDAAGNINSRTFVLMTMLQAKMVGEKKREEILKDGTFAEDYARDNNYDLLDWNGLLLMVLFAGEDLLNQFISCMCPEVISRLISILPENQQTLARNNFLL